MVSGLVTSPADQLRIFSGEASWILMASKSAMLFPRSNGLERYKLPPHLNIRKKRSGLAAWRGRLRLPEIASTGVAVRANCVGGVIFACRVAGSAARSFNSKKASEAAAN